MNKRQRKKNFKGLLTKEELIVLELYRKSSSVDFYLFRCNLQEAHEFAEMTGEQSIIDASNGAIWLKSRLGKIEATAFLKEGEQWKS